MTCNRILLPSVLIWLILGFLAGPGQAQISHPYGRGYNPGPYGVSLPGYPPVSYFNRMHVYSYAPRGAQTVTDFRPLIRAITSLPGWNGKPAAPQHPARILPTLSKSDLLGADGKILWPGKTASDIWLLPARKDAEQAVALVVREHATYGQATIRHVADARNKLT